MTEDQLERETLAWLAPDPTTRARVQALRQRFDALHDSLCRDTATLATDAIEKVLAA